LKGIDLHIHSSFSDDGDFTVDEIFRLAQDHSLDAIAVTDHDTLSHIDECIRISKTSGIELIPGFEITTMHPFDGSQQHILCYFADSKNPVLKAMCDRICIDREELAKERLHSLEKIGFQHDPSILIKKQKSPITATTVIQAILSHPANATHPLLSQYFTGSFVNDKVMSFYREFLASGKPGYSQFRSIPTRDAIEAVLDAHAVPVLAHPVFVHDDSILDDIRLSGIKGIEVYSSYHTAEDIRTYKAFADRHGLIATAGSDFHGPTAKPKVGFASVTGDYTIVDKLKDSIR